MVVRLSQGDGHALSLKEMNSTINHLLQQSVKSEGVINLFADIKEEFSLFDPKFLEEIGAMKQKNLAIEIVKKLLSEQVRLYSKTNLVKSEKFSEKLQRWFCHVDKQPQVGALGVQAVSYTHLGIPAAPSG